MMTLEQIFNTCEAGLWMAMAVAVALGARRKPCAVRRIAWVASIALLLFGVSDLIEVRTGAWWRPWWLFALKAGCVISLVALYARYRRLSRVSPIAVNVSPVAHHENH